MTKYGTFFNFKNKGWEIQAEKWKEWTSYFDFALSWTRNCDHAGFRFYIELCGYFFEAKIYDVRHWDYVKNTWCVYPENE